MLHEFRSLITVHPEKASKALLDAFKKAKCHYGDASVLLGCNQHTFTRWARMLGIEEDLVLLEAKAKVEGWHHGRSGGAGYHKNPELRAKRASRTRKKAKG